MVSISVMVEAKPEFAADFQAALLKHAATTLKSEEACLQFEVSVDPDCAHKFYLHEVYKDLASIERHFGTAHFQEISKKIDQMTMNNEVKVWKHLNPAVK